MGESDEQVSRLGPNEIGKVLPQRSESVRALALRISRAGERVGKPVDTWIEDGTVFYALRQAEIDDPVVAAQRLFRSKQTAREWLERPNAALGGKVPASLLTTPTGREKGREILGRIEHGMVS